MLDVFLWILVIAGGVGGIVVTHTGRTKRKTLR